MIHLMLFYVLEDLLTFVFFMGSHPLELAYIFFFAPYIVRMLSVLLPLLLTTCLLLLLLFLAVDGSSLALPEFLGRTCRILVESLKHEVDGDFPGLVQNDVGLLISCFFSELETCIFEADDDDDDGGKRSFIEEVILQEEKVKKEEDDEVEFFKPTATFPSNKILGWDELEEIGKLYKALTNEVGKYPVKQLLAIRNLKEKQLLASKHGNAGSSEEMGHQQEEWETPASNLEWPTVESDMEKEGKSQTGIGLGELVSKSLNRYGSARREMECKETLASKLRLERWSAGATMGRGLEGMDFLWEEMNDAQGRRNLSKKTRQKDGKYQEKDEEEEEEEHEEQEEVEREIVGVGHICCLQALKFPKGRMNFGPGKVNKLVMATKEFNGGMGTFHEREKKKKKMMMTKTP